MRYSLILCLSISGFSTAGAQDAKPTAASVEFFEKKIRPVLAEHCYKCHSAQSPKVKANLLLDTQAGMHKGGDSGPALVPGHPEKSLIIKALKQTDDLRMPPKGKLSAEIIADFEKWIALGAPDPRDGSNLAAKTIDWKEAREFWAFQPPAKHPLPAVSDKTWPKKDLDFFLLAEMDKRQLKPVRPATKLELIRRATFDLIGLPPTPEEIDAFVKDTSPDAFAKVVDRLLASPHYGERWGRYWLDVSRFADDKALAKAEPYPHAYRYRDWVIQAFNQDMPYDRFLTLQLAGDMLPEQKGEDPFIRLAGLGFQGLGAEYHKGNFAAQVMADELDDRVDTLSRGLLGLTVACARCHDHKYDPIPTLDYYSLAAAYQGSTLLMIPLASTLDVEKFNKWQQEAKEKQAKLTKLMQAKADRKQIDALKADIESHKKSAPKAPPMIHGVRGGGQAMRVNIRGNVERLGDPAPPGFLRIFQPNGGLPLSARSFTRLDLAKAIATPENPLTARVFVNRVWDHHFGRGLVATASNFGKLGDRPTHPELLDTLTVRFIENRWSTKWLHREIMLSAAYRLSSLNDVKNAAQDVENRYLWRMTPRRLDFEAWRDAVLLVSGRLDSTLGGPSFELGDAKTNTRRTIYAKVSRVTPNSMLTMFDFPDANVSSARRSVTTIPQQQLFVLNSEFMIESAKAFAARLEKAAKEDEARIELAFRLAYGRVPEEAEKRIAMEFLIPMIKGGKVPGPQDRLTAWQQYAQAILATNEFAWID